jgi:hypothetical protein
MAVERDEASVAGVMAVAGVAVGGSAKADWTGFYLGAKFRWRDRRCQRDCERRL